MYVVVVLDLATSAMEVIGIFLTETSANDWAIEYYGDKLDKFKYHVEHINHP